VSQVIVLVVVSRGIILSREMVAEVGETKKGQGKNKRRNSD